MLAKILFKDGTADIPVRLMHFAAIPNEVDLWKVNKMIAVIVSEGEDWKNVDIPEEPKAAAPSVEPSSVPQKKEAVTEASVKDVKQSHVGGAQVDLHDFKVHFIALRDDAYPRRAFLL